MRFLVALLKEAELVEIIEQITDCRDAKDNKFLELVVSGKADCVISGDADLLVLNPFSVMPSSAWASWRSAKAAFSLSYSPYAIKVLQPDSSGFPPQAAHSHAIHRVVAFKQNPQGRFNVLLQLA